MFWDVIVWTNSDSYIPSDDDYKNAQPVSPPADIEPKRPVESSKVSHFGDAVQIWFEAEDFTERSPDTGEFFPVVNPSTPVPGSGS